LGKRQNNVAPKLLRFLVQFPLPELRGSKQFIIKELKWGQSLALLGFDEIICAETNTLFCLPRTLRLPVTSDSY
jgi:hypothetical protein